LEPEPADDQRRWGWRFWPPALQGSLEAGACASSSTPMPASMPTRRTRSVCAHDASGHADAAPPRSGMNSRRFS